MKKKELKPMTKEEIAMYVESLSAEIVRRAMTMKLTDLVDRLDTIIFLVRNMR